uniref:Putative non-ribosomal peptide synthetase n=1 Tax=Streptomyces melanovinaceus TaxID=1182637 RepID=A0A060NQP2_9ACTN|nr:putative non-ribosomal peptide synthetase [Streptomyces melanovinaceus]
MERWRDHSYLAGESPAPAANASTAPASSVQEGIWLFERLHPGTSVNHLTYCGRVEGDINVYALAEALRVVCTRHDILRTTFREDPADGTLHQVVHPGLIVRPSVQDLTGLPGEERELKAAQAHRALASEPFDLATGPLLRMAVHHLSPRRSFLIVVAHHLIADGWSLSVFFRELAAAYEGEDVAVTLGKPQQYVAAERQHRGGNVDVDDGADPSADTAAATAPDEDAVTYWRRMLSGRLSVELPTDHPRPATPRFRSGTVAVAVPPDVAASVRAVAAATEATPFMVLLTAFQMLLARMTGQEDISVGSPTAMRQRAHAPRVLGPLVNMLVLRTDLTGDPTFREALERTRRTCLGAYAHQEVPFEKLVEELQPERDLSRSPLFQTMLVLQDQPAELRLGDLLVTPVQMEPDTVQRDVELYLWHGEGITGHLTYNTDLFTPQTAQRFTSRFLTLLTAAVTNPDTQLSHLPVMDETEQRLLAGLSSGPTTPEVPEGCVHEWFEAQADRTPDTVAVRAVDGTLTYRQLDERANQLAHHLREHGVGPETLVGICLPRTLDLVTSLLAVLKAGGAYVPIDPAYPRTRITYTLNDARATVLITTQNLTATLPEGTWHALTLDTTHTGRHPTRRPTNKTVPANLAYTIYTSGSTGRPKGVMIEHRQTTTLLAWAHTTYTPAQLTNVLASTSICFDLSVFEIFAPLTTGGSITLTHTNALDLLTPPHPDITLINTVPSIIQELHTHNAIPPTTTTINLAGEPLPPHLVNTLHNHPHIHTINNLYGPTEDTTYSTHATTTPNDPRTPIGHPLPHTHAHILDHNLNPVPTGTIGELYLTSHRTTRGYHNHPRQTAEHYLPNPHNPHTRLYRTGDLARWRPDGQLDYHGRTDNQIKINGHRIEPAEIETTLLTHPHVQETTITTHTTPHTTQLIAYITAPQLNNNPTPLKNHLTQHLPRHLHPHHYIFLDQLPRTPNQKIDHKALPKPNTHTTTTNHQTPKTRTEKLIATIWQETLHIQTISTNDDFFTLGGHSLLAARIATRLTTQTGTTIPVRLLFEHPTIAELAQHIPDPISEARTSIPRLSRKLRGTGES